jgi:hypothetical protein
LVPKEGKVRTNTDRQKERRKGSCQLRGKEAYVTRTGIRREGERDTARRRGRSRDTQEQAQSSLGEHEARGGEEKTKKKYLDDGFGERTSPSSCHHCSLGALRKTILLSLLALLALLPLSHCRVSSSSSVIIGGQISVGAVASDDVEDV